MMINQLVIAAGAGTVAWTVLGLRKGFAPGIAACACGWLYPEVTALALGTFLVLSLLRRPPEQTIVDGDVIDAEFEVKNGS